MEKTEKFFNWKTVALCFLSMFLGIYTAYALTGPTEREQSLIYYGELQGQKIQLHQQNDSLRGQIEINSQNWHGLDTEQTSLWDRLFPPEGEVSPKNTSAVTVDETTAPLLAIAISKHETAFFTTGVGPSQNNGCGIRYNGEFASYPSREASLYDCERVLIKGYFGATIPQIAQRWTTTQRQPWINNVTYFYENV